MSEGKDELVGSIFNPHSVTCWPNVFPGHPCTFHFNALSTFLLFVQGVLLGIKIVYRCVEPMRGCLDFARW